MNSSLKYIDDTDKSLGIAGMAISLIVCESEELLAEVSMENREDPLKMAEEFFFHSDPRVSAKIAWNEMLKQYQITIGMILGNVLCRYLAAGRKIDDDCVKAIHNEITKEGENCSLEKDEIEDLYNKNFKYYQQLFSHPTVAMVARDFATTLRMQRRMSSSEVMDNLRQLANM